MSKLKTIQNLLEEEIQDLYSAEKQLLKALPKMAKHSNNVVLKQTFEDHLHETKGQVERLDRVSQLLDIRPTGKTCMGMQGVLQEGDEAQEEEGNGSIIDLGIIGAGSRVEHYEMAAYTTAINLAHRMGAAEVVSLLKASLAEEQAADQKLRKIASDLLKSSTSVAA